MSKLSLMTWSTFMINKKVSLGGIHTNRMATTIVCQMGLQGKDLKYLHRIIQQLSQTNK
jgi:hypothetical protein